MPAGPSIITDIRNGVVNVCLEATLPANTTNPNNISYQVTYRPTLTGATPEVWLVPTPGPVDISVVRQPQPAPTPATLIQLSQISTTGAMSGQSICFIAGVLTYGNCGNGLANPMTTLGDMIYEDASPGPARLAGSTAATMRVLTQTGTGSASAAPAWGQANENALAFTDILTLNSSTMRHGLLPKLSGNSTDCLNGLGTFGACPSANVVSSVFGRIGVITAQNGDYTASQITGIQWSTTGSDIQNTNSGNVGIGAAPGAYKLDVTKSGSTGTLRVYDQTASTGFTYVEMQQGANQCSATIPDLMRIYNNAGAVILAGMDCYGDFYVKSSGGLKTLSMDGDSSRGTPGINLASSSIINFYSQTSLDAAGAYDAGLGRNAAGVLEVDSGTLGVLRDLTLRNITINGTCTGCSGGVSSVFTRTGAVTAQSGDYTAAQVTNAVSSIAANTAGASFTLDASASTSAAAIRLPNIAGASSTTAGALSYDTTNNNVHSGANGIDNLVGLLPSSITPANNDCAKFTVAAGVVTLNTAGGACGAGGSGTVNSGTAGHLSYYATSTNAVSDMGADFTFNTHTLSIGSLGLLDLSAASSAGAFRVPNLAGASSTVAGVVSYDTTNKNIHAGANGVDNFVALMPSASPPTTGNCVQWSVVASVVRLSDAGAACGSGGGSGTVNSGTATHLSYYATSTNAVSDMGADFTFNTHTLSMGSSGLLDLSAASGTDPFKMPVGAGLTAASNGSAGFDSTNKMEHNFTNGVDSKIMTVASSASITNGHCTQFAVVSSVITLADAGSACGSGGGGITPAIYDTFTNVTGTACSGTNTGQLGLTSDSLYTFRCNGSTWDAFALNRHVTVPPATGWSWDNQTAGSTIDSTNGFQHFVTTRTNIAEIAVRYMTAPSTPYFISTMMLTSNAATLPTSTGHNRDANSSLFFRDGTGKIIQLTYGIDNNSPGYFLYRWTNSTTRSTIYASSILSNVDITLPVNGPIYLGMADDGTTNLKWYWSIDGKHWNVFDTVSRTNFFGSGPTQVGFGAYNGDSDVEISLLDWSVSATIP